MKRTYQKHLMTGILFAILCTISLVLSIAVFSPKSNAKTCYSEQNNNIENKDMGEESDGYMKGFGLVIAGLFSGIISWSSFVDYKDKKHDYKLDRM